MILISASVNVGLAVTGSSAMLAHGSIAQAALTAPYATRDAVRLSRSMPKIIVVLLRDADARPRSLRALLPRRRGLCTRVQPPRTFLLKKSTVRCHASFAAASL
jgi:hypothetical protein